MTTKQENDAIAMQREVLENEKDINNFLSVSNKVGPLFHTHFIDMETGNNGIANLILLILAEKEATFKKGVELTEDRGTAINLSLFASEIIEEVKNRFSNTSKRYPYKTIHAYLSIMLFRSGKVGKIKLSNAEDKERDCRKPRTKWYVIKNPDKQ